MSFSSGSGPDDEISSLSNNESNVLSLPHCTSTLIITHLINNATRAIPDPLLESLLRTYQQHLCQSIPRTNIDSNYFLPRNITINPQQQQHQGATEQEDNHVPHLMESDHVFIEDEESSTNITQINNVQSSSTGEQSFRLDEGSTLDVSDTLSPLLSSSLSTYSSSPNVSILPFEDFEAPDALTDHNICLLRWQSQREELKHLLEELYEDYGNNHPIFQASMPFEVLIESSIHKRGLW